VELATERWPQLRRGRVSDPAQAALSGSHRKAPSSAGGYLQNADLWQALDVELSRHQITCKWVKGHSGNHDNERCDALASDEAQQAAESIRPLPDVTTGWELVASTDAHLPWNEDYEAVASL
jgi:hypothetical protein